MLLISGVFTFAIWQKLAKIAKFSTRKTKYVQGSLTVFPNFTQKIYVQVKST